MKGISILYISIFLAIVPTYSLSEDIQCASKDCHININDAHVGDRWGGLAKCVLCHGEVSLSHTDQEKVKDVSSTINRDICYECHLGLKDEMTTSIYYHFSDINNRCIECHIVHNSSGLKWFTREYVRGHKYEYRADYTTEIYALCWKCHDAVLAETEYTYRYTNFRDHNRNMHFLHSNKKKGITCRTCHQQIHGSSNKEMVEAKPIYNMVYMKPGVYIFSSIENGGNCRGVMCHRETSYDRVIPSK